MFVSLYRSEAGRKALRECYDDAVAALPVDVEERTVETRYGDTHVLLAGAADAPPVFVFHGGNATNPMTLSWYTDLADRFRLVAPDTIGQPGKSVETRVDPTSDAYGHWVIDVMDAFDVASAPMIGTSYGAGIVLVAGTVAPARIERAALVVPAGFGTGPLTSMIGVGVSSMTFRFYPNERILDRALASLMTEPAEDSIARATVAGALRHVTLDGEFPEADAGALGDFDAPIALYVAADDPFFPPDAIVPRARERLPNLASVTVLDDEKHILSRPARGRVTASVREFFS